MSIRTNGAEWKAFCAHLPANWWIEDAYITIEGKTADALDLSKIDDADILTISCGWLQLDQEGKNGKSLEQSLRFWRKRSDVTRIVVEVPKDREIAIREAIEKAGGTFIG